MNLQTLLKPPLVLAACALLSVLALAAAFASEAFLGLEPCPLCVYQRWPYAVVAALGILALCFRSRARALEAALALCSAVFLVNAGIAFYHTGVELHWWVSAVEGCAVPTNFGLNPESILENIMSAPTGRCDEIPWADPVLGLSMANYNVMMCLGLSALCGLSFIFKARTP